MKEATLDNRSEQPSTLSRLSDSNEKCKQRLAWYPGGPFVSCFPLYRIKRVGAVTVNVEDLLNTRDKNFCKHVCIYACAHTNVGGLPFRFGNFSYFVSRFDGFVLVIPWAYILWIAWLNTYEKYIRCSLHSSRFFRCLWKLIFIYIYIQAKKFLYKRER